MKLLVDVGNTRLKSAVLVDGELTDPQTLSWGEVPLSEKLPEIWADVNPSEVAISSVAAHQVVSEISEYSLQHWNIEPQLAQYKGDEAGLICGYKDPQQIGIDRWLAMQGAWGRRKGAWLVADLGTAATLDVIRSDGQHLGGCIYAGVGSQRHTLAANTALLPNVNHPMEGSFTADNTADALVAGTLLSVIGGVHELWRKAETWVGCEGLQLCMTGGDAEQVAEHLTGLVQVYPALVLEGLAIHSFGQQKF